MAEGPPAETRSFVTVQTQKAHGALVGEADAKPRLFVGIQVREVHESPRSVQRESAPTRSLPSQKSSKGQPHLQPADVPAVPPAREPHEGQRGFSGAVFQSGKASSLHALKLFEH